MTASNDDFARRLAEGMQGAAGAARQESVGALDTIARVQGQAAAWEAEAARLAVRGQYLDLWSREEAIRAQQEREASWHYGIQLGVPLAVDLARRAEADARSAMPLATKVVAALLLAAAAGGLLAVGLHVRDRVR